MDIKITEASLFLHVTKQPKVYVGNEMPYVVSTIGTNIERVVPSNLLLFRNTKHEDPFPFWITNPQQDVMKFIYSSQLQNIECNYNKKHSILTLHGIKHKNFENIDDFVNTIFNLIDTEYDNESIFIVKYKAIAKINIQTPWDIDVLADIIMNNPEIAQSMALCERTCTLGNKRFFSVAVSTNENQVCRVALTYRNSQVIAMISKLPSEESSQLVVNTLEKLLEIYTSSVSGYEIQSIHTRISNIESLRQKLPELFVNNYTRECPMLPIMISQEEAERIKNTQRVILYPMNSDKGRYYTAPEGYFVGLKRNRLDNKHDFPYLVTCYLQDHMKRSTSDTYKYYYQYTNNGMSGSDIASSSGRSEARSRRRPLPKSIYDPRYHRKRVSSFISAVESATNTRINNFPWFPQIVKQELWDKSDDEIMSYIRKGSGSCVYRYFEELIGVSIHVVAIKEGNFEPLVPRHRGHYVWDPPYPSHIVIFETYKTTYGKETCSYSFLAKSETTVFDENDNVVSYLISQKSTDSVRTPVHDKHSIKEQIIDRNGKCRTIITDQNLHIDTYTRPLNVPVIPEQTSFFDSHIRKMNVIKEQMGIQTTELSKRSTSTVLYFPNDASFKYYVGTKKKSFTS